MAERVVVVCDVCGSSPAETVGITANAKNYRKDLCSAHLAELVKGTRAPTRGRRRASAPSTLPSPRSRRRSANGNAQAQEERPKVKRPRRRITDPAILQKRQAALEKARKALAEKRAAARNVG